MYREYYQMARDPFAMHPSLHNYFESVSHASVYNLLKESVDHKEPYILVEGEYGTGKTLICLKIIQHIDSLIDCIAVPVSSPAAPYSLFLKSLFTKLNQVKVAIPCKTVTQLEARLFSLYLSGREQKTVYILIDDLQDYDYRQLDQYKILANFHVGDFYPFNLLCISHPEYIQKLESEPKYIPLLQRFRRRMKVEPLQEDEVKEYLYFRLLQAGARGRPLFNHSALSLISSLSDRIPRRINTICDKILLHASQRGIDRITLDLVDEVCNTPPPHQAALSTEAKSQPQERYDEPLRRRQLSLNTILVNDNSQDNLPPPRRPGIHLSVGQLLLGLVTIVITISLMYFISL
jgi:type II secretory pathway predicted ATPase ExeA